MYTENKKYLRMTFNERMQHYLLLTSFITLVITGFALKFPEALWVKWFRNLIGEGAFDLRSITHKIAAVIMVADTIYHVFYISFTERGKKLVRDLWFRKNDLTELKGTIRYFIGKAKTKPAYGRFSYIEKMEYWAVVWGTVIMGITGVVLWFENTFLPVISNSGMDIATAIHYYEAILAALSIFVWHFYFVIYNPDVYPMNKAWLTGYMNEEEMEKEHPMELEEIMKQEQKEVIDEEKEKIIGDPETILETETNKSNVI
jgi:formate dehydrogenase gamma subunit